MVTALILLSAILNASWNAFVKNDSDRAVAMAWIMGLGGLASLCVAPFIARPAPEVWPYLLATTIFQNIYIGLVLLSYRHGDLSQAYPIARGTAALAAAIVSSALGIDVLTPREWAGILLSSMGIASLAFAATGPASTLRRAVGYPLLSGLCTAGYSIVDGSGVRLAGSPFEYVVWMNLCASPFLPAYVLLTRRHELARSARGSLGPRLFAAAVALSSYSIAVWAFSQGSIGRIAVLRETSVLFAAILGSVALKEPFGTRRILSAMVILLGFALWP
ncbi:MAG: EamA family transporter [Vicinamibacteria bacterium]|nr:EamA family transporter [Vicinamibacteria bacterium]